MSSLMLTRAQLTPGTRAVAYRLITDPVEEQWTVYWRQVLRWTLPLHEMLTAVALTAMMATDFGLSERRQTLESMQW